MHQVQLHTACEGPLALNDIALELCREFLPPDGAAFFTQVSRYDDYLADIAQKPGHQAGDASKLILPFLRSAGLTNDRMAEFSRQHLRLMPKAEDAYPFLHTLNFPIFAFSAGYGPFARAVAARLGFGPERCLCTEVDLDRYELSDAEAGELRRFLGEIAAAPALSWPPEAKTPADLAPEAQEALGLMDRIFEEKIPSLDIGRIYREVNAMGGPEKARALEDSLAQTGLTLANAMYVGDSRTDAPALEKVRAGGGVALALNADRHALQAAEVVVVADTAWPVALLVAVFLEWGKEGVVELAQSTRPGGSKYLVIPETMIEPIMMGLQGGKTFNLYHPGTSRREEVIRDSEAMRRRLRGEGEL
jgi:energy-converting hydrogenase A subunit R